MKLALGVLLSHGFPAPTEFWDSYEALMHHVRSGQVNDGVPPDQQIGAVRRIKSTAFPPDIARNEIVRTWLDDGDEDYLLFLDADMTFPADVVRQLVRHAVPVVTGRYHMRKPPYHSVAYVKHRTKTGAHCYAPVHWGQGLVEIERGGAGCLLIRRDVAEAIRARIGHNWFRYQRGPEPPHDFTVSEDFWFYQQALEAGFKVYLDWDCGCEHLQTMAINRSWNESYLDAQVRELPDLSPDKRAAVLDSFVVCGFPDGLTLPNGFHIAPYTVTAGER